MSNRVTKLLTAAILIGAPASALARPRTLASGAPACGNTMGKGGYRARECTAEELQELRIQTANTKAEKRAALVVQEILYGDLEPAPSAAPVAAVDKAQAPPQLSAIEVALLTIEALPRPQS